MDWKHIASMALGAALVTVGALVPAAGAILIPTGMTIIGGTLGIVAPKPVAKPKDNPK